MQKKIICMALMLISSMAFAQNKPINISNTATAQKSSESTQENDKYAGIKFTNEQIKQMNLFLSKGDYQNFYTLILSSKVSKDNYISYLLSKEHDGIIPIYWLISDFYAKEKKFYNTHKWFYISLIMTQQDSYLCSDRSARNAPRKLMEFFPESVNITRATPQYIEDSMREVNFFITNLKTRIDPSWVCYYANSSPSNTNNLLIPRESWSEERRLVFKNFVDKYQK